MAGNFPRVIRIGHVVLSVADLAASRHFYVDLLGFNVLHETDRALYLRGVEDREWSLKLELGSEPGVRQLAYKAGSEVALDEIAGIAQAEGLPHRWESDVDRPRVLRLQDPFGFPDRFLLRIGAGIPGCCSASICIAAPASSASIILMCCRLR